jgi:hypothetical protein
MAMIRAPLENRFMRLVKSVVRPQVRRRGDHSGRRARTEHPIVPGEGVIQFDAALQMDLAIQI